MKVLIELSDNELKLVTEEELEKINDELDEFDGMRPYIFRGYLHEEKLTYQKGIDDAIEKAYYLVENFHSTKDAEFIKKELQQLKGKK